MEKTKYNPSFYLQDKISENPQLIKEALMDYIMFLPLKLLNYRGIFELDI